MPGHNLVIYYPEFKSHVWVQYVRPYNPQVHPITWIVTCSSETNCMMLYRYIKSKETLLIHSAFGALNINLHTNQI